MRFSVIILKHDVFDVLATIKLSCGCSDGILVAHFWNLETNSNDRSVITTSESFEAAFACTNHAAAWASRNSFVVVSRLGL